MHAARRGELELLESLRSIWFNFPSCCFSQRHKDAVTMLIEFGADLECQDAEGHTPLHLAVEGGSTETVEVLIDREANMKVKRKTGATPLYISKLKEYEDVTQLLLDKGAAASTSSSSSSRN